METILVISALVLGFIILSFSAKGFIHFSEQMAIKFKMPPLLIGVLLVGFGTSFPELVVSAIASVKAHPQLAIGNAIGSNIINIGLVLGLTALFYPLQVHRRLAKRELPLLFFIAILVGALIVNGFLSRIDGLIMVIALGIHLYWLFFLGPKRSDNESELEAQYAQQVSQHTNIALSLLGWLGCLALLYGSSELIVYSATHIAKWLGLSDLVIGLTVVALGTSLPELAATLSAATSKKFDIAIGNIVGSNIFNLLGVMAMPALISPTQLSRQALVQDYPIMLGFIAGLWLLTYLPKFGYLGRASGVLLLAAYIAYTMLLIT